MKRRHMLKTGLALGALPTVSWAQTPNWPQRPVRVIVPFAAGSFTETAARAIGQELSNTLGQPFVIDARPGAGTRIGTEATIKAPKDGYTLGVAVSASGVSIPALDPKVTYDPLKDFTFLSLAFEAYFAIAAHPSVGVKTLDEFISLARAKPGSLNYATSGIGTSSHVWVEVF